MGFGIRVQRIWKINLAGCSGPHRKGIMQGSTYTFWTNLGGDPLPGLVLWGVRTRVPGKGSKHGFRVMVRRTGKTLFGRLLWAFIEST